MKLRSLDIFQHYGCSLLDVSFHLSYLIRLHYAYNAFPDCIATTILYYEICTILSVSLTFWNKRKCILRDVFIQWQDFIASISQFVQSNLFGIFHILSSRCQEILVSTFVMILIRISLVLRRYTAFLEAIGIGHSYIF